MQYIIFDLEATCWDRNNIQNSNNISEVIEIGAVKLNENLEIISEFQCFVKPAINPILSDFCKNLTNITQEQIDSSKDFHLSIKDFEKFISNEKSAAWLCSWGFYDKSKIKKEMKEKNIRSNVFYFLNNHISIKHQFGDIYNIKPCGMDRALNILKIPLDGTHHRAIDDARNITKIFIKVFDKLKFE